MIKTDLIFRIMLFILRIRDVIAPVDKKIDKFDIKRGNNVIDYGCGAGSYIKRTSELIGENGKLYAVDIHNLAIKAVTSKINKYQLRNVVPVLAKNNVDANLIKDHAADIIFAMDMFHMVQETNLFLRELHRLTKKDGCLFIEPEHMSLADARKKILDSGLWKIECDLGGCLKCVPIAEKSSITKAT